LSASGRSLQNQHEKNKIVVEFLTIQGGSMLSRRNFIKNCAAAAAILSGSGVLSKFNTGLAAEGLNIPVLCYHRVGDTRGDLTITPDKFATDLSRLREEGYETISLETFRQ
jgi:hypothetical protein